jgi:hypothetical protein
MTELQNTSNSASYNNWLDRPNNNNSNYSTTTTQAPTVTQLPPINFNNNTMDSEPGLSYQITQVKLEEEPEDNHKPAPYPYMTTPNASSSWINSNNSNNPGYSPKDSCELSYEGEEYRQHGQPTPSPTASTEQSRSKKHRTPSTRDIHVERNTEGKPPYSYATLIKYAIENSQRKKLTLSEIYQWVIDHYPYYATAGSGWKVNK